MIICFDVLTGIAGDMLVASLVDAGVDFEYIKSNIDLLGLDVKLELKEKFVNGIKAKNFIVNTHEKKRHFGNYHRHYHRTFKDIKELILKSSLNQNVKEMSIKIFEKIAQAEANIHSITVDNVGFHEVGADDSIVDIVSFSLCIDYLKPEAIYFSPLLDGRGFTKSMHGVIPVPAPAVLEIARLNNIPIGTTDINSELITPTGIGITAAVSQGFLQMPQVQIEKIGYGSGTKDLQIPNLVRAIIGEKKLTSKKGYVAIFANIDDMTGEKMALACEKIMQSGASDVYFTPIYMKKGRPAYKIGVIASYEKLENIVESIFRCTSTIGVRFVHLDKIEMNREVEIVNQNSELRLKISSYRDIKRLKVEFEDLKKLIK
ncbi:nickel pincer cofactor biosynthesis protein LarC [Caldicellulosiruptor naganoensis]|uniref:Nickel pincer cofactor biosynthesis protein LarC n=1 Tax=Caldicellulosiruptor naganoensis TaxID=29324 RepID=A0ABY7BG84_9FIRM|nr:nickel pincer cofactor biosynthesis protein LarC [Caldicellulosiruptor naganoensis]WAM31819.1 nickel pincer cofactor biosynthesis protein LarC [Caldicellulosiruptor naganoensis]